ncbi:MAG: NAD-dependent dehydratase [Pseudomonadales bacterium]|nr:NAD-dependent dehydratase [Pseudomonadales bacterium]
MGKETALVIGGTGPTGPSLVNGLRAEGFTTTILHTGRHEVDTIPPEVEHIHTNPFKIDEVATALGDRTFDIVYSMYGRLRDIAPWFVGKTGKFVAVGGVPSYLGYAVPSMLWPPGLSVPIREDAPRSGTDENEKTAKMVTSEDLVFEYHPTATLFRYPLIYGPGQILPREWLVVKRILDGRRRMIVADGGLSLRTAGYGPNVGHALSLVVSNQQIAQGKTYNVGDENCFTAAQTIEILAAALDVEIELVSLPVNLATPARPYLTSAYTLHHQTGIDAIRTELNYRDVLPAVEALAITARYLRDNPIAPGSITERRLQDPFDYAAEDALIDAYLSATTPVLKLAKAYDPDFRDRYAPGSEDWRLVDAKN